MEKLDMLMEQGLIQALETRNGRITVLDKWENRSKLRKILHDAVADVEPEEEFLEDKDWNKARIETFQPLKAEDRIWITPPWSADQDTGKRG
ncbi:MAG: 50S ribosomal protein L11 methyltransferase [Candidatus Marinimicrobia bacterium]|nr:50S ribosomal protein L11 methyltransferase [Candidatus Neomarinimicrobiota bacterium]